VNHNSCWHTFNEKTIHFKGSRHSKCIGNDIHDGNNEGILFEDGGGITCSDDWICDNEVEQCDSSGIRVNKGINFTIDRNKTRANGGEAGICCAGISYSSISNNECISNEHCGMKFIDDGATGCTYNTIGFNLVMDDGTGTKGSDRGQ
jgi:hypothetical protein